MPTRCCAVKNNPFDPSNRRISILIKNDNEPAPIFSAAKVVDGSTPLPGALKPQLTETMETKPQVQTPGTVSASKPPAQVQAKSRAGTPEAKPSLMDKLKAVLPGTKK
jgi:hypothetical protein